MIMETENGLDSESGIETEPQLAILNVYFASFFTFLHYLFVYTHTCI